MTSKIILLNNLRCYNYFLSSGLIQASRQTLIVDLLMTLRLVVRVKFLTLDGFENSRMTVVMSVTLLFWTLPDTVAKDFTIQMWIIQYDFKNYSVKQFEMLRIFLIKWLNSSQTRNSYHWSIDDFTIAGTNEVFSAGWICKFHNGRCVIVDVNVTNASSSGGHRADAFKTHHGWQVGDHNTVALATRFGDFGIRHWSGYIRSSQCWNAS